MNYIIDESAYDLLNKWVAINRQLLKVCLQYNKHYEKENRIDFVDVGGSVTAYYSLKHNNSVKFSVRDNAIIIKGNFDFPLQEEENDIRVNYKSVEGIEDADKTVECVVRTYMGINAFMFYGNLTEQENRVIIASGKTENGKKVITLRGFNGKIYAIQTGHHKSPEGIFSVRGHFRQYKSGKVVWIDEYLKGTNQKGELI